MSITWFIQTRTVMYMYVPTEIILSRNNLCYYNLLKIKCPSPFVRNIDTVYANYAYSNSCLATVAMSGLRVPVAGDARTENKRSEVTELRYIVAISRGVRRKHFNSSLKNPAA